MSYENREEGLAFENLFEKQCQLQGFYAERNYYTAKRGFKGRPIIVHSNLDFTVIDPSNGRTGFFDCKSFQGSYFTYSTISDAGRSEHQIERSKRYNEMHVRSGFVVFLREINAVMFYRGSVIQKGYRFDTHSGEYLGTWDSLRIKPIFTETLFSFNRVPLEAP
jgi:hypothetical protein